MSFIAYPYRLRAKKDPMVESTDFVYRSAQKEAG